MNKITLLPSLIDKINDVIVANDIVSEITLEQDNSSGIDSITTMSWYTEHNGYHTKMTVEITGVKDW